jgi:hypothetical protein
VGSGWGRPEGSTTVEFVLVDLKVDSACGNVEQDDVAVLDEGQWAADGSLGSDVEDDGAVRGSAHAGVGDSD